MKATELSRKYPLFYNKVLNGMNETLKITENGMEIDARVRIAQNAAFIATAEFHRCVKEGRKN